jgi:hypothetical protein
MNFENEVMESLFGRMELIIGQRNPLIGHSNSLSGWRNCNISKVHLTSETEEFRLKDELQESEKTGAGDVREEMESGQFDERESEQACPCGPGAQTLLRPTILGR